MKPGEPPNLATQAATAATLRQAVLGPYDVIVLAAAAAVDGSSRLTPPTLEEVSQAAEMVPAHTLLCLGVLERQRLVSTDGQFWTVTRLGEEILAELIRRETRRTQRSR